MTLVPRNPVTHNTDLECPKKLFKKFTIKRLWLQPIHGVRVWSAGREQRGTREEKHRCPRNYWGNKWDDDDHRECRCEKKVFVVRNNCTDFSCQYFWYQQLVFLLNISFGEMNYTAAASYCVPIQQIRFPRNDFMTHPLQVGLTWDTNINTQTLCKAGIFLTSSVPALHAK